MTSRGHKTQQQQDEEEQLALILSTVQKHPNSRVCKLVTEAQNVCTRANIAALLTELAEHSEFSVDFNISLGYYLDKFSNLINNEENIFTETSFFLTSSTKIYIRRVDNVKDSVDIQLQTLRNALEESKENDKPPPPVKRGRRRAVEATEDCSEVVLEPKKFTKLSYEKLLAWKKNKPPRKEIAQRRLDTEQYLHPAGWMTANIVDFENDGEVDTKRNYKLFTHHLEHRYNTLVPDINFRLHFKMKDFIEEEAENDTADESEGEGIDSYSQWPEHSEAHVKKYLHLEDRALEKEMLQPAKSDRVPEVARPIPEKMGETPKISEETNRTTENTNLSQLFDSGMEATLTDSFDLTQQSCSNFNNTSLLETSKDSGNNNQTTDIRLSDVSANTSNISRNDSGYDTSLTDASTHSQFADDPNSNSLEQTQLDATEGSSIATKNDSGLDTSLTDDSTFSQAEDDPSIDQTTPYASQGSSNGTSTNTIEELPQLEGSEPLSTINETETCSQPVRAEDEGPIILSDLRIRIPSGDDGISVFFSELDERVQQRISSPTVVALDVLPNIPNKEKLVIRVDAEIMSLCNLDEPETHVLPPKVLTPSPEKVQYNILKINEKVLRRRVLFKLTSDFELLMQARKLKRSRVRDEPTERRKYKLFPMNDMDTTNVCMTPARCMSASSDLYGFSDASVSDSECFGFDEDEKEIALPCRNAVDIAAISERAHFSAVNEVTGPAMTISEAVITSENTVPPKPLNEPSAVYVSEENITSEAAIPAESNSAVQLSIDASKTATGEENPSTPHDSDPNSIDEVNNTTASEITEAIAGENSNEASSIAVVAAEADCVPNAATNENIDVTSTENAVAAIINTQPTIEGATEENSGSPAEIHKSSRSEWDSGLKENEAKVLDQRIKAWHERLAPKLSKAHERHNFKVFDLGTDIINKFEKPKDTVSLEDIMENKDKTHISRYLFTSLTLLNENNLKLVVKNKSSEKPLAWNEVQFQLLSTKRRQVDLADNIGSVTKSTNKSPPAATVVPLVQKRKSSDRDAPTTSIRVKRPRMASININLNVVKALKAIEKKATNEDEDSGVYSAESVAF